MDAFSSTRHDSYQINFRTGYIYIHAKVRDEDEETAENAFFNYR